MGDISKNFSFVEFEKSDTAMKRGIDNSIRDAKVKASICSLVKNVLQPLREHYGKPLTINSGYRCAALNRAVSGVATSQHVKGEAADIAASDPYGLARAAFANNLPYDQMILYPTFVHFSHRREGKQRRQILYNYRYKGRRL